MKVKICISIALMFSLVLLIGCNGDDDSDDTTGPGDTTYVSQFLGTWLNEDADTGGITKVEIRSDGSLLYVHMWGACSPTDCDWGEVTTPVADANDPQLTVVWDQDFVIRSQTIEYLSDGRLRVESSSNYTDGRPDRTDVYYFYKL